MDKSFAVIFEAIQDRVFRYAIRMLGNEEDAGDVVQDVGEKLLRMGNDLWKIDNTGAYALTIARNLCMDRLRHEQVKVRKLAFMMREDISGDKETHVCERKNMAGLIRQMIDRLPEKQKTAIHLRDVEGYEYEEIARIMGSDVQAVRMNLSRARKTIKEKLIKLQNYGL